MNTRLQVEHPVTEVVFGVDLVELQLARRRGRGLPTMRCAATSRTGTRSRCGSTPRTRPHDYQPQSGRAHRRFEIPDSSGTASGVDAGFESGSEVSTHYDAMLAKVIACAPTRGQAARRLAGALRRARIHGSSPTATCWSRSCATRTFLAGEVSTALPRRTVDVPAERPAGRATAGRGRGRDRAGRASRARAGPCSAASRSAWRNVVVAAAAHRVRGRRDRRGRVVRRPRRLRRRRPTSWSPRRPDAVTLETDGVRTTYDVAVDGRRGRRRLAARPRRG